MSIQRLHECQAAILQHPGIDVDQLARLMYMSRPTLYRKLKEITGLTPHELINEIRLKKAAELLADGRYRAFEVARIVGFTSQSSFGKSFLRQFKVSPAMYRRQNAFTTTCSGNCSTEDKTSI